MAATTNILIVGVGGQGIVLAGDVIGLAARLAGLEAKASEIHGMSQRGGSVVSEVRFGAQVFSPLIPPPGADFLLAFEMLEGMRGLSRLRPGGLAIVNRQQIIPASVTYGSAVYPASGGAHPVRLPGCGAGGCAGHCDRAGQPRALNSVLMGVLASRCSLPLECWENALRQTIKPRFIDLNIAAFQRGYELSMAGTRS